jgi:hypothetical protein
MFSLIITFIVELLTNLASTCIAKIEETMHEMGIYEDEV